jgi:microcystin-dependent protein
MFNTKMRRIIFKMILIGCVFGCLISFNPAINIKIDAEKSNYKPSPSEIPYGLIAMWAGSIASIPSGWVLCNGSNSTPDLRDKYILSVGTSEEPGAVGGATSHLHTYNELPQHTHSSSTDGNHWHTVLCRQGGPGSQPQPCSGSGSLNFNTDSVPNHTHTITESGTSSCSTDSGSSMPPYYKLAYIMKQSSDFNIPLGIILLWSGSLASIPSGWNLCNGSGSTPDLRDRFALGVSASENPGAVGGTIAHTHTYSDLPLHTHTTAGNGTHSHNMQAGSTLNNGARFGTSLSGSGTGATESSGAHNHIINLAGITDCETDSTNLLPPFYKLAYIIKTANSVMIPANVIMLWSNVLALIPAGWILCNGTDATPDLRDKFPLSVGISEDPGGIGGTSTHNHTYSDLPQHQHNMIGVSDHTHNIPAYTSGSGTDRISLGTAVMVTSRDVGFAGSHNHTISTEGILNCETDNENSLPPYYKLAFVYHSNNPPQASNLVISPDIAYTSDNLHVSYDYDDIEGPTESGTEIRWYKNTFLQSQFNDMVIILACFTNKSDSWYCTIRPRDNLEFGELQISSVKKIKNTIPDVVEYAIGTSNRDTTVDIQLSYTFVDLDLMDQDRSQIIWYKDGIPQSQFENQTIISAKYTNNTENWYTTIQPFDGSDYGSIGTTKTTHIDNLAPDVTDYSIYATNRNTTADIHLTYNFIDIDLQDHDFSRIRWYKKGVEQSYLENKTAISNIFTNNTEVWYVTIQAFDGMDFGPIRTTGTTFIDNLAPDVIDYSIGASNRNTTTDIQLIYNFIDIDLQDHDFSCIRWYKKGIEQLYLENETAISNIFTNNTEEWYATIQAFDGMDFGPIRTTSSTNINNLAPDVTSYKLDAVNRKTTTDIQLTYSFEDIDLQDQDHSKIIWYRNEIEQPYLENLTIISACWTNKSEEWYATIQAFDGMDFGIIRTTEITYIYNSVPDVSGYTLGEALRSTMTDIALSYIFEDYDFEDLDMSKISWYRNGIEQTQLENLTIVSNVWTNGSDSWYATILPFDGTDFGHVRMTSTIYIEGDTNTEENMNKIGLTILISSFGLGSVAVIIFMYRKRKLRAISKDLQQISQNLRSKQ